MIKKLPIQNKYMKLFTINNKPTLTYTQIFIFFAGVVFATSVILAAQWFNENYTLRSPIVNPIQRRDISPIPEGEDVKVIIPPKEVEKPLESKIMPTTEPLQVAVVTAYSCGGEMTPEQKAMNCPNGTTATGTIPVPYKTIACDKDNLGRTFYLEGIGEVQCEDTGGAIQGSGRFDLYLPTYNEAIQFGTRKISYEEIN